VPTALPDLSKIAIVCANCAAMILFVSPSPSKLKMWMLLLLAISELLGGQNGEVRKR
jgi:hypothetical protein